MPSGNYIVSLTISGAPAYWADVDIAVSDKTKTGFTINLFNSSDYTVNDIYRLDCNLLLIWLYIIYYFNPISSDILIAVMFIYDIVIQLLQLPAMFVIVWILEL